MEYEVEYEYEYENMEYIVHIICAGITYSTFYIYHAFLWFILYNVDIYFSL